MKNAALDFKKKKRLKYGVCFWYEEITNDSKLKERLETILHTNESMLKYDNEYLDEYDNKVKYLCEFLDSPDGLILDDYYLNKKSKNSYDESYYKKYQIINKIKEQIKSNYETWNDIREDI